MYGFIKNRYLIKVSYFTFTAGKSHHAHRDLFGHSHLGLKILHIIEGGSDLSSDLHHFKLLELLFFLVFKLTLSLRLKHVVILDSCNKSNRRLGHPFANPLLVGKLKHRKVQSPLAGEVVKSDLVRVLELLSSVKAVLWKSPLLVLSSIFIKSLSSIGVCDLHNILTTVFL